MTDKVVTVKFTREALGNLVRWWNDAGIRDESGRVVQLVAHEEADGEFAVAELIREPWEEPPPMTSVDGGDEFTVRATDWGPPGPLSQGDFMLSAVPAVEAEMMCRRCGHVRDRHVGCGRDCPICGGEESCLDCMDADPHGDTDLHFFEPIEKFRP